MNDQHNITDKFSKAIRQKLENHPMEVNPEAWKNIEKRLRKPRNHKALWVWIPASVAAVLAMVFTINIGTEKTQNSFVAQSKNIATESTSTNQQSENFSKSSEIQKNSNNQTTQNKPIGIASIASKETKKAPIQNKEKKNAVVVNEKTVVKVVENDEKTTDLYTAQTDQKKPNIEISSKTVSKQTTKDTVLLNPDTQSDWPSTPKKNQNGWLLAAAVGSSSSISANQSDGLMYSVKENSPLFSDAQATYLQTVSLSDYPEKTLNAPLSFGLNLRHRLNDKWSVESGIMYTYLQSSFKKDLSMQRFESKLHLHYIGIPLNVILQLWKFGSWEIYLSSGAAVEKGLQSVYIENRHQGNATYTTTAKENIDGLQWSLNEAIGISYKFDRKMGIYFEPKFSYFFKNNQPISARTENPVSIGFVAGVRVDL